MHAVVLKYFTEVAVCGSIRRAAERLYVASSAINRQILQLEEELGTPLFDRLPNGVRLNPAGNRLLRHVQETLHGFSLLQADLEGLAGEKKGHITVAAMDSLFLNFLLDAVRDFTKSYPAVTYSLSCGPVYEVMDQVASGECDIGMCFVNNDAPHGVKIDAMVPLPPGVVMSPDHPLSGKTELTLNDCKDYPLVRHGAQLMSMQSVVEANFVKSWDSLDTRLTCNFAPMLKELVLDGTYISFFSKISWLKELEDGRVAWRPLLEAGTEKIELAVVLPKSRQLSNATLAFAGSLGSRLHAAHETAMKIEARSVAG